MQHTKNIFYIFFVKNTSQLIAIKHFSQILKALINQILNPRIYLHVLIFSREIQHDFICPLDT
jgi:hypothetical protein